MNHSTVSKMFHQVTQDNKNRDLYFYKNKDFWSGISGLEIRSTVEDIAFGLHSIDIGKGSNIALLSANSPRWAMSDYGIICSGAATVSIYPTLIASQVKYIINDSNTKVVFVENQEQLDKINEIWSDCSQLSHVIVLDGSDSSGNDRIINFMDFLKLGTEFEKTSELKFEDLVNLAAPEDLLTLIYTSGTTGDPKGVMLTHGNLMSNVEAISKLIYFDQTEKFLSFLPLSHVFERMGGHFTAFSVGAQVYYAENIEKVPENLREVKPSVVLSVPRLYEKMYNKVLDGLRVAPSVRQKIFWWAISVGKESIEYRLKKQSLPFLLNLKHKLANKLVYSKVKDRVGGNLRFFISGGAPLSKEIAEFFAAVDITILEGYGLSETSPVLTTNSPENLRFGSVGRALFNVEIKIAEDGEILAKGPNIMQGYYNKEDATKDAIDQDGWLHTGDIGHLDDDQYLFITDRKKNILVTSGGKNVAPAPMENAIVNSPFIEQSVVIGDKRNFISALIVPSFESIEKYFSEKNKTFKDNQELVNDSEVIALIKEEVDRAMKQFSNYERIKEFRMVDRLLSLESGELTPTLKVVRKVVLANFSKLVDQIYKD